MANRADELLASVDKDVLADIGWQISKGQIGSAPADINELVTLARKWFSGKYDEVRKSVCPYHDRIKELLTSDISQAMQLAGDAALAAATGGVSPITLGRFCIQIGIDNLCKE
jgi:phage-related minor tail protein